jgi:hypothetical protein
MLYALEFNRTDSGTSSVLVMDTNARIMFASSDAASILGYTPAQLMTMDGTQLMPSPFNALHATWLKVGPLTLTRCSHGLPKPRIVACTCLFLAPTGAHWVVLMKPYLLRACKRRMPAAARP